MRLDDLQIGGLSIFQYEDEFCFGTDAVLLSHFADIKKNDKVIDLGCGNGIIPILLSHKTKARHITGLEIIEKTAKLARKNVRHNNLEDKISIVTGDLKNIDLYFKPGEFDCVVTNPPYKKAGSGIISENETIAAARHEILCDIYDIAAAAAYLLPLRGKIYMIHRPERLCDIILAFKKEKIEVKILQFVCPKPSEPPSMVLVCGAKGEKPNLKVLENIYVYNADGNYSDTINEIYRRKN